MRPPQFAGERLARPRTCLRTSYGFNEAPAVRGGKVPFLFQAFPTTNCFNEAPAVRGGKGCRACWRRGAAACFNEAPAVRGGKERNCWRTDATTESFNEAPAVRGGKEAEHVPGFEDAAASMRPPQFAGERCSAVGTLPVVTAEPPSERLHSITLNGAGKGLEAAAPPRATS